jgi:DMSO/TMAO reductase YedYZ molybdopterin-dependent catalytic subunit
MDDRLLGRAAFLGVVGTGVAGLFVGRDVLRALDRFTPEAVDAIAPTDGWRIFAVGDSMPVYDPATFRLAITGNVDRPATLTVADLRALPRKEVVADFHCVTGWSVEDVHWAGVSFRDLLDVVSPLRGTESLRFVSAERPYDDSLLLEQALLDDALLAYEMDGKPLTRPHGAPLRVVMPQMFGYKGVKWVQRIEVRTDVITGYWEQRGYDSDAWIGDAPELSAERRLAGGSIPG